MREKYLIAPVVAAFLFGLGGLGLWGCGGSGSSSTALTTAHVRFLNSGADSTSLSFSLNETVGATGLAYLASSPTFASFQTNSYDVTAIEAGATATLSDEVDTLSGNTSYLVIGYGLENFTGPYGPEPDKRFRASAFQVDTSAPNGTKARIIVFNAFIQAFGYDTPNIDFQDGSTPQFPLTNIAFGSTASELVDPGTIAFEVLRDGTPQQYASDPGFTFVAGKTYLALVTGVYGQTGTEAPQIKYIALN